MTLEKAKEKLVSELQASGLACRMVSIRRLCELEEDIKSRHREGMFDQEFYQERITQLKFDIPPADCLIIVTLLPWVSKQR